MSSSDSESSQDSVMMEEQAIKRRKIEEDDEIRAVLYDMCDVYDTQRMFKNISLNVPRVQRFLGALKNDLCDCIQEQEKEYIKILKEHSDLFQDFKVLTGLLNNNKPVDQDLYRQAMAKFKRYNNRNSFDFKHKKCLEVYTGDWEKIGVIISSLYRHDNKEDYLFDVIRTSSDETINYQLACLWVHRENRLECDWINAKLHELVEQFLDVYPQDIQNVHKLVEDRYYLRNRNDPYTFSVKRSSVTIDSSGSD